MPYTVLEKKMSRVSPQFMDELAAFVDFLLFRQDEAQRLMRDSSSRLQVPRKLGGFEKGFYMAPDFDEPLEEFKEYM